MYTQLYDLVSTTALGEFLNDEKFSSHPEECLELYNLYLFDFVKSVYRTTQECEVEVPCCAIYAHIVSNIYAVLVDTCFCVNPASHLAMEYYSHARYT